MRTADRIAAAALLVLSLAFAAGALKYYTWWDAGSGPGSAFLPFWLGLGMAVLATSLLFRSLKQEDPGEAWLPRGEGFEFHLLAMAMALAVVLKGSGSWSVDRVIARRLEP